jgi:hypothetical protein
MSGKLQGWERLLKLHEQGNPSPMSMSDLEKELYDALFWALPLAEIAMENHRQVRLRYGHNLGTKRIGLTDDEVEQLERARATLKRAAKSEQTPG